MNNRKAPMSFNTLKRSNREERLIRRRQGRMVLLAIFAVIILLAVTGLVFLICHLVNNHKKPDLGPQDGLPSDIVYEVITKGYNEIRTGDLVVVNATYAYTFPALPIELMNSVDKQAYDISTYRQPVNGSNPYVIRFQDGRHYLNPNVAAALNNMLTAYGDKNLVVYEGYRSYNDQASGNYSVKAGHSEHHTGLAVSLSSSALSCTLDYAAYSYLYETCYLYGFIQRYPAGKTQINYPECFRYVGVPHAAYIYRNGITLEQYVELLRKNHSVVDENTRGFNQSARHLIIDVDQNGVADYGVYYIPANTNPGELSTLYVPQNYAYTVSGDNIGGFIITVDLTSKNG